MTTRATKTEQEKRKLEQEKLQAVLGDLLREEENKYCADCDSKGPRWASWNLGVFLCIRCAGIHRNLGVHLSKVKSINLDSWTPEQVQSMRVMGNAKSRAIYEAAKPESRPRPLNDQGMETFIRSKYERKAYIMKDWQPPRVDARDLPCYGEILDIRQGRSSRPKHSPSGPPAPRAAAPERTNEQRAPREKPRPAAPASQSVPAKPAKPSALNDLVDLSIEPAAPAPSVPASSNLDDLLGLGPTVQNGALAPTSPVQAQKSPNQDLLFGEFSSAPVPTANSATNSLAGDRKSTADILALYGSGASTPVGGPQMYPQEYYAPPQQMYPNPGAYGAQMYPGHPYQNQMVYGAPAQMNMIQGQMAGLNLMGQTNTLSTNLWQ